MNLEAYSDGKRAKPGALKRPHCFVLLAIALAGSAPFAGAQEIDIVGPLTDGVRCFGSNAKEDLEYNIKKLGMTNDAIADGLDLVAGDATRCGPVREAANELASVYLMATPPDVQDPGAVAGQVVEQTLAEADRNAANLKFEVGPPPRNMTKGRGITPQSRP